MTPADAGGRDDDGKANFSCADASQSNRGAEHQQSTISSKIEKDCLNAQATTVIHRSLRGFNANRICRTFKNKLASPKQPSAMTFATSASITTATSATSTLDTSLTDKETLEEQPEVEETVEPCTVVIRVFTSDAPGASTTTRTTTTAASCNNDSHSDNESAVYAKEEYSRGIHQSVQEGESDVINPRNDQTSQSPGYAEYDDGDDDDSLFHFDEVIATIAKQDDEDESDIPLSTVNVGVYAFSAEQLKSKAQPCGCGSRSTMEETWYSNTQPDLGYESSLSTMDETWYSNSYSYYSDEGSMLFGNDMCQNFSVHEMENTADATIYSLTEKVSSYLENIFPKSHQRLLEAWREHQADLDRSGLINKPQWFMGHRASSGTKRRQARR